MATEQYQNVNEIFDWNFLNKSQQCLTTFPHLNTQTSLNISINKIKIIPKIKNNLKELIANKNEINYIEDLSQSLEKLNLSHNNLITFEFELKNLTELYLSNNKLTKFDGIFPNLKILDLSYNELTQFNIKNSLINNISEKELIINVNVKVKVPNVFNKKEINPIPLLEKLNISHNNISKLENHHREIDDRTIRKYMADGLFLNMNYESIFHDFYYLKELDISSNNFEELTIDFPNLTKLECLSNNFKSIPEQFKKLETIYLDSKTFKNLTEINLSDYSQLKDLQINLPLLNIKGDVAFKFNVITTVFTTNDYMNLLLSYEPTDKYEYHFESFDLDNFYFNNKKVDISNSVLDRKDHYTGIRDGSGRTMYRGSTIYNYTFINNILIVKKENIFDNNCNHHIHY